MRHKRRSLTQGSIASLIVLFFAGCGDSEVTPPKPGRDLNTPNYVNEAIEWNSSLGRYVYFSWKGTRGSAGCEIHINVHDGVHSAPPSFNGTYARPALINARREWVRAIRDAGIECETVTRFESEGQSFSSRLPRIDVHFLETSSGGSARGGVRVTADDNTRTFSRVYMEIAASYGREGDLRIMNQDDYMTTLAHEFGHAFGIYKFHGGQGHSSNSNDVMYSPSSYWTLSNGDRSTIATLYSGEAYYRPMTTLE